MAGSVGIAASRRCRDWGGGYQNGVKMGACRAWAVTVLGMPVAGFVMRARASSEVRVARADRALTGRGRRHAFSGTASRSPTCGTGRVLALHRRACGTARRREWGASARTPAPSASTVRMNGRDVSRGSGGRAAALRAVLRSALAGGFDRLSPNGWGRAGQRSWPCRDRLRIRTRTRSRSRFILGTVHADDVVQLSSQGRERLTGEARRIPAVTRRSGGCPPPSRRRMPACGRRRPIRGAVQCRKRVGGERAPVWCSKSVSATRCRRTHAGVLCRLVPGMLARAAFLAVEKETETQIPTRIEAARVEARRP